MKTLFIFNVQSFSDVITNSSSELFIINNSTDKIIDFIKTLYLQYKNADNWNFSGSATGCKISTMYEEYKYGEGIGYGDEPIIEFYISDGGYSADELDKLFERFGDVIEYDPLDNNVICIKHNDLTIDRYVELRNLIDHTDKLTANTVFLEIDHNNSEFLHELRKNIDIEFYRFA